MMGTEEPDDLGDDGRHVPADLTELFEVLDWQAAVGGDDDGDPVS